MQPHDTCAFAQSLKVCMDTHDDPGPHEPEKSQAQGENEPHKSQALGG